MVWTGGRDGAGGGEGSGSGYAEGDDVGKLHCWREEKSLSMEKEGVVSTAAVCIMCASSFTQGISEAVDDRIIPMDV